VNLRRLGLITLLLIVALALQTSVVSRLDLPGATPDLVLLVVVSLALADGPLTGVVAGFAAGIALDLVPPADHAVGRYAFVLTLVGYLAGLAQDEAERSVVMPFVVVAAAAAGATALYAGIGALFSDFGVDGRTLVGLLPTAVLYDVLLAPFVVPAVRALVRRAEPDSVRW
jgi:rod shape-determining protein MreD